MLGCESSASGRRPTSKINQACPTLQRKDLPHGNQGLVHADASADHQESTPVSDALQTSGESLSATC